MKTKKRTSLASISTLAGGLLLILATTRGTLSHLLLGGFVFLWCAAKAFARLREPERRKAPAPARPFRGWFARFLDAPTQPEAPAPSSEPEEREEEDAPPSLLLQHVEARITELLCAAYPDASWQWCEDDPEQIISAGSIAWLRTWNTGAYRHATLSFENPSDLQIELVQTTRLKPPAAVPQPSEAAPLPRTPAVPDTAAPPVEEAFPLVLEETPEAEEATDVALWYGLIGQKVLTQLITDLNARQCHQILIDENGDIFAVDEKEQAQKAQTLDHMPARRYWDELKALLTDQELDVSIEGNRMAVSW